MSTLHQNATLAPFETGPDPELLPYLRAETPEAEDRALETLLAELSPIIRGTLRKKLTLFAGSGVRFASRESEAAEDLYCAAVLRLLEQLRLTKAKNPQAGRETPFDEEEEDAADLRSVRGLAHAITRNLVYEQLRQKYPRRASLRNQLVYLVRRYRDSRTGELRFALWVVERDRLCGYLEWRQRLLQITRRYQQLLDSPAVCVRELGAEAVGGQLAQFLVSLFHWLNNPMRLDDLVGAVAQLRGVEDHPEASLDQVTAETPEGAAPVQPAHAGPTPEEQLLLRTRLARLWEEILRLPPPQCAALLLNLRDDRGRGVIDLLPALGIATVRQIAAALALPAERLAELWPSLPLDDTAIGAMFNCPVGRVAVWRWRARQKLEAAAGNG